MAITPFRRAAWPDVRHKRERGPPGPVFHSDHLSTRGPVVRHSTAARYRGHHPGWVTNARHHARPPTPSTWRGARSPAAAGLARPGPPARPAQPGWHDPRVPRREPRWIDGVITDI